ncbi:GerMN domain-containing protein [Paenibacillus hamazuiensis]|uniref:GerMN domain-containing protein n=1 Tax=Paenibacillus hamazuiensis TaxID=2936508 RepID=UPI00200FCAE3|nr:GerMN domain-containing protein [Paenibacillus hamazuiensis]
MLKKMYVIAAGACLLFAITGCGQAKTDGHHPASGNESQAAPAPVQSEAKKPVEGKTLKAYFGDENGEKLIEKEIAVSYKQDEDKYLAALGALATSSDAKLVPLCKGFTFKSAVRSGSALTVDLSISPEARKGAPGEELVLEALRRTLFQFPEIEMVDILVDGKKAESLMGHMDLPHPMKRS